MVDFWKLARFIHHILDAQSLLSNLPTRKRKNLLVLAAVIGHARSIHNHTFQPGEKQKCSRKIFDNLILNGMKQKFFRSLFHVVIKLKIAIHGFVVIGKKIFGAI